MSEGLLTIGKTRLIKNVVMTRIRYKTKRSSLFVGFEFHIRRGNVFFFWCLVGCCGVYYY